MEYENSDGLPKMDTDHIVIRGVGRYWVNGLASAYSEEYDAASMHAFVSEQEFKNIVTHINDVLANFFPCPICYFFGFACCPCSLALSCVPAYKSVREAQENVIKTIDHYNIAKFASRNMRMTLEKSCFKSYLKIQRLQGETEDDGGHTHIELVESRRSEKLDDSTGMHPELSCKRFEDES